GRPARRQRGRARGPQPLSWLASPPAPRAELAGVASGAAGDRPWGAVEQRPVFDTANPAVAKTGLCSTAGRSRAVLWLRVTRGLRGDRGPFCGYESPEVCG